jgi:hypothetical protein
MVIACEAMAAYFPNINLEALSEFAAETAAAQHASRHAKSLVVTPRVNGMQDILWAGEKVLLTTIFLVLALTQLQMIHISFDRATIPDGPYSMLAHFPTGRPRLTTQAVVWLDIS